ncbi:MAG: D-alanyl-D-alanine carboxypeptidase [Patescibacteria group bacterium]|nr:serine hydrolase [Patescibacteria group bacterium]MDE1945925.1 D-alanyl-D-alanine carboxypeptidase [Patescibacteria group bacterium]
MLIVALSILAARLFGTPEKPAAEKAHMQAAAYPPEFADIQAKAFYVYDVNAGTAIFEKNATATLPLASITKLMTTLVIAGNLPASSTATITRNDLVRGEDTNGLIAGEKWKAEDLLDFSLIMSSNTGMYALADALNAHLGGDASTTIHLMNAKARELGFSDTVFFNESGLDLDATTSGSYSSARDAALLMAAVLKTDPSLLAETTENAESFVSLSGIRHTAVNTDTLVGKIVGLVASKTGFTDLAGGNLVVALDAGLGHPVVAALLGSTEEGRFSDMQILLRAIADYYSRQ